MSGGEALGDAMGAVHTEINTPNLLRGAIRKPKIYGGNGRRESDGEREKD